MSIKTVILIDTFENIDLDDKCIWEQLLNPKY